MTFFTRRFLLVTSLVLILSIFTGQYGNVVSGDDEQDASAAPKVDVNIGKAKAGSKTDDEVVQREEEAIKLDGLNAAQIKELREKAEKHTFQAEVNRMMKLIINSLYKNKEIFLRELISNASDALDKIRFLSLTNPQLDASSELCVKIKADKDNHVLHITDAGIGMTKEELIKNLGTIAKSGTSDFVQKMKDAAESPENQQDLIGQFGVGFYSAFLVADRVVVTSKSDDDEQWIWESDANSFSIMKDPRGNTLKRGTQVSLHLKEEAHDFLEPATLKTLVKKYSQFINFSIYLWTSTTKTVEEPVEEDEPKEKADAAKKDEEKKDETEEEAKVEEEKEDTKPKTKKVDKTTWDWELINDTKPLWVRKPADIKEDEYNAFYKSISKDYNNPLDLTHFTAEGEVTFKSLLFVPSSNPQSFTDYGKKHDSMKLYVRRVFITDDLPDLLPNYLHFIKGLVDSDDLPLNVSRETLQQNKLMKVIKKKLVRKVLDMFKKMDSEKYRDKFWKEYSTNIKLGLMEDSSNRSRLSKLLLFKSSASEDKLTSLEEYKKRMDEKQEAIYYIAGTSMEEVRKSPFVERLLKKNLEVLYLTDPVDEYAIATLTDFDGKRLQNVAKEGLKLNQGDKAKERTEQLEKDYKPLTDWLRDEALKDKVEKAIISERLTKSPCALVANSYGWSGNMERLMKSQAYAKPQDPMSDFYGNQKKILEINPRHPVVKELLELVKTDKEDKKAKEIAQLLHETSTIRSGYILKDTAGFADRIEAMLRQTLNINPDEMPEEEPEEVPETTATEEDKKDEDDSKKDDDFEDNEKPTKEDKETKHDHDDHVEL